MDPARATELAREVAAALAAAHAQGIVHRDVKPANVLIAADTGTVKVADFGIARAANARQGLTMPGTVLGTATYLSPEQAQGAEVDHRTDVYSLGMVLYEMLTGKAAVHRRQPGGHRLPAAAARPRRPRRPTTPTSRRRSTPSSCKAMSKDPGGRQASAEELREELLAIDRAVGDPDATAAIVAPATAAGESTAVLAGSSTSVLPPVAPEHRVERVGGREPVPPEVYRRRRAAVIAAVALAGPGRHRHPGPARAADDDKGTVAVPNVVGLSVAEATRTLDRRRPQGPGHRARLARGDRPGRRPGPGRRRDREPRTRP